MKNNTTENKSKKSEIWLMHFPHSLHKEIKVIASDLGYPSMSAFVREAMREQLDREKPLETIPKSKFKTFC